jgi:hypothetical protein
MPVMFEEIEAEIADERRTEPEPPTPKPPHPGELGDQIRRELALIEVRRSRLIAD